MSYSQIPPHYRSGDSMGIVSAIVTAVSEGANIISDIASGGPQKRARAEKARQETELVLAEAKRLQDESRQAAEAMRLRAQGAQEARQRQETQKQKTQMLVVGGLAFVGILGVIYWVYD